MNAHLVVRTIKEHARVWLRREAMRSGSQRHPFQPSAPASPFNSSNNHLHALGE